VFLFIKPISSHLKAIKTLCKWSHACIFQEISDSINFDTLGMFRDSTLFPMGWQATWGQLQDSCFWTRNDHSSSRFKTLFTSTHSRLSIKLMQQATAATTLVSNHFTWIESLFHWLLAGYLDVTSTWYSRTTLNLMLPYSYFLIPNHVSNAFTPLSFYVLAELTHMTDLQDSFYSPPLSRTSILSLFWSLSLSLGCCLSLSR
jgi:hypothetical protein